MSARKLPQEQLGIATALVLLIGCGAEGPEQAPLSTSAEALFQFRLVHHEPGPQLEPAEYQGETIYLATTPLISDPDLQSVEAFVPEAGELRFDIVLRPDAVDRITSETQAAIGTPMAIVVDGQVRSAPIIRDALGPRMAGRIQVTGDEAERLAAAIRRRWP